MKACCYARYSTQLQSPFSIADQFRLCERLAERRGFVVVAQFRDAAISGGTAARPGYQEMLSGARRHEFDVIVAEDTSRLWRNFAEQSPRLAELADLGIQVVTHDLDTRHESAEIMGAVGGAMASAYRKEISRRTRRGLEGLSRAGKIAGGRFYGYVSAVAAGKPQRTIDPVQAAVVVRIFEMYAAGSSAKTIAATLNAESVPSPGSTWARAQRRAKGWVASAIAGDPSRGIGLLINDSYRGRSIWNRSRWVRSATDSSNCRAIANPRSEWIEHRDESLRIVSDELWIRAKARQSDRQHTIGQRITSGLSRQAAAAGRAPRYVFSGWLVCSECGARFTMVNARSYGCASFNGSRACANGRRVRHDLVEDRLLAGIRASLNSEEVLDEIEHRVRKALAAGRQVKPDVKRIADLKAQVDNLVGAIAGSGMRASPALGRKLAEVEAELGALEAVKSDSTPTPFMTDVRARVKAAVARLPKLLEQDTERARAALRDAGIGPVITMRPASDRDYLNAEFDLQFMPLRAVANDMSVTLVAGACYRSKQVRYVTS